MKFYTYKEIETDFGLARKEAIQRVWKMQIPIRHLSGVAHFNKRQVDDILNYQAPRKNPKFRREKIIAIETYLRLGSGRKTTRLLNISKHVVESAIREWKEDGHVIVESSMNYDTGRKYKNVLQRGNKWSYSWKKEGTLYCRGGFQTEEEAWIALNEIKNSVRIAC